MRRIVATVIVLVLLAAGAWMLGGRGGDAPRPAPERDGAPAVVDDGHDGDDDGPRRRRVAAEPVAAADDDDAAGAEPGEASDDEELPLIEIVDGDGTSLAGVPVVVPGFRWASGADGRLRSLVPAGETVELPTLGMEVVVEAPLTRVQVSDAIPVELRFVDQDSGRLLEVAWERERSPAARRVATWARPGGDVSLELSELLLEVPEGWVSPVVRREIREFGSVARRAQSVVAVVAVPREVRVGVTVLHADGRPADGAAVAVRSSARGSRKLGPFHTDESGHAELRGVPFVRGERVIIHAGLQVLEGDVPKTYEGWVRSDPLAELRDRIELTIRLPEQGSDEPFEGPASNSTIGIGGSAGGAESSTLTASVRVRARLRDGRPAVASPIALMGQGRNARSLESDAQGVVVFDGVTAGAYDVWLVQPGAVPTRVPLEIADGEAASVELVEAPGRALDVEVVDARGAPLPGARVYVRTPGWLPHWPYLHVAGGVQHLPAATDGTGRIRMIGLAEDVGEIGASYGSRTAQVEVEVGTSTDPVRIVIPDAR
jgi:hypothetical protein